MDNVLCMNCGTTYDPRGDCPQLGLTPHSAERAGRIARYLLDRGCREPRPLDVKDAAAALDAIARG